MKNGAKIAHITWKDGMFIREIDGRIGNEKGQILVDNTRSLPDGWYIVEQTEPPVSAGFLFKEIVLHLEAPKRVWNYSGHPMGSAIAKAIRTLHGEVELLRRENTELIRLLNGK